MKKRIRLTVAAVAATALVLTAAPAQAHDHATPPSGISSTPITTLMGSTR